MRPGEEVTRLDEDGENSSRSPHAALVDHADGLHELRWGRGFVDISLGSGSDCFEDGFVIGAGPGDDDAQVRTRGLEARHYIEQVLPVAAAEQHQIDVLAIGKIGYRSRQQLEVSLGIEQSTKPDKAKGVTFHNRDSNM